MVSELTNNGVADIGYIDKIHEIATERWGTPLAFVRTFGCQQNVSDSERICGMLVQMGFGFTDSPENANLILFNTCAVRENAEDRVFGNVGHLKSIKERRGDTLIALCGCMMQQEHIADKIRKSYPYVGLVFGTNKMEEFPELIYRALTGRKRVFDVGGEPEGIAEDIPVYRKDTVKAWLSVMYGCNNFCSYCVVPYVRGRERSRAPEDILKEAKEVIAQGCKEITLLGQNVNSYGKGSGFGVDFPDLLAMINELEGDFTVRFMTSHPKDATKKLFDTMARCEKVCRHLHLPFQAGNNEILRRMNRGYTREQYMELIAYAREKMPDLAVTSDVIVGFPGETYEQFCDTLDLIERVEFTSLFTFIYSPRVGTPAASMADSVPYSEKVKWFGELTSLQERVAGGRIAKMKGQTLRVLVESFENGVAMGRTGSNLMVEFKGKEDMTGNFVYVKIIETDGYTIKGEAAEK